MNYFFIFVSSGNVGSESFHAIEFFFILEFFIFRPIWGHYYIVYRKNSAKISQILPINANLSSKIAKKKTKNGHSTVGIFKILDFDHSSESKILNNLA